MLRAESINPYMILMIDTYFFCTRVNKVLNDIMISILSDQISLFIVHTLSGSKPKE